MPGRVETFQFADLPKLEDVQQTRASVTGNFERWRRPRCVRERGSASITRTPAARLESHRGWVYRNKAYLVGPQGTRRDSVSTEHSRSSNRRRSDWRTCLISKGVPMAIGLSTKRPPY